MEKVGVDGKHKLADKGFASVFESHLRELNAPFMRLLIRKHYGKVLYNEIAENGCLLYQLFLKGRTIEFFLALSTASSTTLLFPIATAATTPPPPPSPPPDAEEVAGTPLATTASHWQKAQSRRKMSLPRRTPAGTDEEQDEDYKKEQQR
ncbi:hypothetical protein Ahy_A04g018304 [Arachis hypogaea]|uniref:Uncharacterized protein n=1 Tax=Arachis hypogaea TaxID=3818 RepID=A0A445DDF8_ARAHY|nr:hypothetical protein Ahy_A04g018304 [Arachis hypogaea]